MKNFDHIKRKLVLAIIVIVIILGITGYIKVSTVRKTNLLSNRVEENILRLVELSTVKYNYTNIAEYEDNIELSGISIPFTNKKFILKYSGYIKAGIDLSSVEVNLKDKETIEIKMDKAKVFENVIPEEDVYFYDERDSVFNKLSFKDLYVVLIQEKEKMKEEVIEKGILNDAEKNGKEVITSLLEGMGFKKITIVFK